MLEWLPRSSTLRTLSKNLGLSLSRLRRDGAYGLSVEHLVLAGHAGSLPSNRPRLEDPVSSKGGLESHRKTALSLQKLR